MQQEFCFPADDASASFEVGFAEDGTLRLEATAEEIEGSDLSRSQIIDSLSALTLEGVKVSDAVKQKWPEAFP